MVTHLYIEVEVDGEEVGQTPEKDAGLAKAAPSYYFGLLGDQPNEVFAHACTGYIWYIQNIDSHKISWSLATLIIRSLRGLPIG